jgi:adenosylcobyric acid synthase
MLGKTVVDRKGIEDGLQTVQAGLSLLDITTEFEEYSKLTRRVSALAVGGGPILGQAGGSVVEGYEIHMGRTLLGPDARPAFKILDDKREEAFDGAVDSSGLVFGTYIHGLFDRPPMSEALLRYLALKKGLEPRTQDFRPVSQSWASSISLVADVVSRSLDILEIYRIVGLDPESVPETPDRESLSEPC